MKKYNPAGVGFIEINCQPPFLPHTVSFCTIWFCHSVGRSFLTHPLHLHFPSILTLRYYLVFFSFLYFAYMWSHVNLFNVCVFSWKLGSGVDKPIGEVCIHIELYTHPKSGERKVTVKGQSEFFFLKWCKKCGILSNICSSADNIIMLRIYYYSCGGQWLKMADVWHVQTLCGDHHDRSSPQWQETEVPDQVQEQQLVSQVQWNLPFVSPFGGFFPPDFAVYEKISKTEKLGKTNFGCSSYVIQIYM